MSVSALLNLDIAWCYLKLGNLSQLPDAEQRLNECEMKFQRSYGTDMQRVVAIKGSADNERALYLRLHLLQVSSEILCMAFYAFYPTYYSLERG